MAKSYKFFVKKFYFPTDSSNVRFFLRTLLSPETKSWEIMHEYILIPNRYGLEHVIVFCRN